jgi:pyruvate dehydrogenase E1 component alpha subunit
MINNMQKDTYLELYKKILSIRRVEEIVSDEYRKGTMRTPTHLGIGQEAVAVGVCQELKKGDVVFTHHRSHTHYLAQGGSLLGLFAELFGRIDGCSRGRGGSVHLVDSSVGFLGSSPILGHSLALAAGSALAFSLDDKKNVGVAFFGEGAFDEGSVWETINFAAVKKLPVIFVCENNGYATESPMHVRVAAETDFCEKVKAFGVKANKIDGNNLLEMNRAAKDAIEYSRSGQGPILLECMTYRWREHVGPLWDHEVNRAYRSRDELNEWMKRCPVASMGRTLIDENLANQQELDYWLKEIDENIMLVMQQAQASPWPNADTLFENVY